MSKTKQPEQMYTTKQMMELLGIKSRQTVYSWGANERAVKAWPGGDGAPLMWPASLIRELAAEHGIEVDL